MMDVIYKASSGDSYSLQTNGKWIREANYHAWAYIPNGTDLQFGKRVSSFAKEPATYKTVLTFHGTAISRAAQIAKLHEEFENDIRSMKMGRLIWGDWYVDCYIIASSTNPVNNDWTENEIEVYCPNPFWIKQEKKSFQKQDAPPVQQEFLDYDYDYDYDYFLGAIGTEKWVRSFPFSAEFQMLIYGPVSNPRITINGYPYQVDDTLESAEYMAIDSRQNTITKYLAGGTSISIFDKRNKVQSVFEQIPGGTLAVNWTGLFGFDLIIFDERSEPEK